MANAGVPTSRLWYFVSLSLALIEPDDEAWLELLADTDDSGDREIGDTSPSSVELAIY